MLGELFYLFRKYGDVIARSYRIEHGRLELETDMSGEFIGYCGLTNILIFSFDNVKEAILSFRREIERLCDGQ